MKKRVTGAKTADAVSEREERNRRISYEAALEGIVLLKNDGALPLPPGKIALYGAGVSHTVKGGTGSGEVNERRSVTILEGMKNAGYEITTGKWISEFEADCVKAYDEFISNRSGFTLDVINEPKERYLEPCGRVISDEDIASSGCDTAIYVVARQAGEGADKKLEKGEFDLRPEEIASIEKMAVSYKNSVLVINSGSYMNIGDLDRKVSAVIFFCQQGMEGGNAFADIISGKVSPSGRLTDSWARSYSDVPYGMEYSYTNGDTFNEYYREGIYVGYRYYDTCGVAPRYRFGYGLSYTSFTLENLGAELDGNNVTLRVKVTNEGSVPGKEVVQAYVSAPAGELIKEYRRLVSFGKTGLLQPGEREVLELSFTLDYMASYCEKSSSRILEKGDYVVCTGTCSDTDRAAAVITLDDTAVLAKYKAVCPPDEGFEEMVPEAVERHFDLSGAVRLSLRAAEIPTEVVDYSVPEPCSDEATRAIVDSLTEKELIDVCVGEGMLGGVFATNGVFAPGTVGRTESGLLKKGLINVNLSDGPAGLRLLKESGLTAKGGLRFVKGSYLFDYMKELPAFLMSLVEAKEGRCDILRQYTTSFPVATSLAQSWNEKLCEKVGRAVSEEMEEYYITYWLAPAINIHKNPLCGRNFEYMSEDPVLSGKISAAITRGVQSIPGNYVTVKHFACNNVEDNRQKSNSHVGERALREIYLRAFEISVREGGAKSVMTSYNKLNGVYTPDSADLCTAVLRNEWGFKGVVMTDWLSTAGGKADAAVAVAAGNDLLMPGQASDKRSLRAALKSGALTAAQLKAAASNIVFSIVNSSTAKKVKPEDLI